MDAILVILFMAFIFLIGFLGTQFFRKTKISDIFFLIIIGYVLGSGFHIIPESQIILLKSFAPVFGALALIILLFEGGLHLNFYKVIREFGNAAVFTLLVFLLTMGLTGVLLYFVFNIGWLYGFLIGSILGGVSSAVVIPLVRSSSTNDQTKTMLTLESAITDVLCVIVTIAIVDIIISQTANIQFVAQGIASAFAIATVVGVIAGIFWLKILRDFSATKEFGYFLTLSFLFVIYSITESVGGNGAFCALIFGLVLGNASEILKIFKFKEFELDENITKFQAEISLFIKTFFFIYLGIIVDFSALNLEIILIVLAVVVISIISRILIAKTLFIKNKKLKEGMKQIISLHARGLAAAVLATYPLSMGLNNSIIAMILPISFLVIVATNLTTTIGFFITENKKNKKEDSEEKLEIPETITD